MSDQERLRRLRDRQLAARDPHSGRRRLHHDISTRQKRSTEAFSLSKIWGEVPAVWKGGVFGLAVGALGVVILPMVWTSPWAMPCAGVGALFLALLGLVVGRAFDTRDSLRDLIR